MSFSGRSLLLSSVLLPICRKNSIGMGNFAVEDAFQHSAVRAFWWNTSDGRVLEYCRVYEKVCTFNHLFSEGLGRNR